MISVTQPKQKHRILKNNNFKKGTVPQRRARRHVCKMVAVLFNFCFELSRRESSPRNSKSDVGGIVVFTCVSHPLSPPLPRDLPLFLLLVHGDAAGPQGHHQEETPDDGHGLEEVVLEEVVHGLVGGDRPEGVEVEVDAEEPDHQGQGGQLGLEAHGHQDDQGRAHDILEDLGRQRGKTESRKPSAIRRVAIPVCLFIY